MIIRRVFIVSLVLFVYGYNAQSKEEVYNYLLQIGCDEAEIVTKQSVQECGHKYQSYNARVRHNLFGLWNHAKQEYYKFDTWQESCDAYLTKVQYKRKKDEPYYEFLERIGYASDPQYINKLKGISL